MAMKCRRQNCPNSASTGRHRGYCAKHYRFVPKGLVDAAECKAHVRALRDAGYSLHSVAEMSGLDEDTLRNLGTWTAASRVALMTHLRIVRIPLPEGIINGGAQDIANVGTKRRIQALMASGYPLTALADELGVTPQNVNHWLRRERVTSETVERVSALFDRLQLTPGPSKRAALAAARKGWPRPFDWDEDLIDDPTATPQAPKAGGNAWFDDYQELRGLGLTNVQIADRMGIKRSTLVTRIRRSGR
jgi:transcriptional regulator with XRE-family HTH domain